MAEQVKRFRAEDETKSAGAVVDSHNEVLSRFLAPLTNEKQKLFKTHEQITDTAVIELAGSFIEYGLKNDERWETQVFPLVRTEALEHTWNVTSYRPELPTLTPNEGISQLQEHNIRIFRLKLRRLGVAIRFEGDDLQAADARTRVARKCAQAAKSFQSYAALAVVTAMNAVWDKPNLMNKMLSDVADIDYDSRITSVRNLTGIANREQLGMFTAIQEAINLYNAKNPSAAPPTHLVIHPNAVKYLQGPYAVTVDGITSFRGLRVVHPLQLTSAEHDVFGINRIMTRTKAFGEFVRATSIGNVPPAAFTTSSADVKIFDLNSGAWTRVPFSLAVRNAGRTGAIEFPSVANPNDMTSIPAEFIPGGDSSEYATFLSAVLAAGRALPAGVANVMTESLTMEKLDALLKANIPVPVDVLLVRQAMNLDTQGIIVFRAGADVGTTLHAYGDTGVGYDVGNKMQKVHVTMWMGVKLTDPDAVVAIPDVVFAGVGTGCNAAVMTPTQWEAYANNNFVAKTRSDPSVLPLLVPAGSRVNDVAIHLPGRITEGSDLTYASADVESSSRKFNTMIPDITAVGAEDRTDNTICYPGSYVSPDASGSFTIFREGRGVFGSVLYAGAADSFNGSGTVVDPTRMPKTF